MADFIARVGLPVHLGQLSISADDSAALHTVADVALSMFMLANEPFAVTREMLLQALGDADALGRKVAKSQGEAAYRKLQGKS